MNEKKTIVGLYPRVSTEDQSRFGHSLDEQEDKLKQLCNFKDYEIKIAILLMIKIAKN